MQENGGVQIEEKKEWYFCDYVEVFVDEVTSEPFED